MKSKKLAVGFITIGFVLGLVCGIFAPSLYAKLKKKNSFNIYEIRTNSHTYVICDYTNQFEFYSAEDGEISSKIESKQISSIIKKCKNCFGYEFVSEKMNDSGVYVKQSFPEDSYITVKTYSMPDKDLFGRSTSLDEMYEELKRNYGNISIKDLKNAFNSCLTGEKTYTIDTSKEDDLFNTLKETVNNIKEANK